MDDDWGRRYEDGETEEEWAARTTAAMYDDLQDVHDKLKEKFQKLKRENRDLKEENSLLQKATWEKDPVMFNTKQEDK